MVNFGIMNLTEDGKLKDFQHGNFLQETLLSIFGYLPTFICKLDKTIQSVTTVVNKYCIVEGLTYQDVTNKRQYQVIITDWATFTGSVLKTSPKSTSLDMGVYDAAFYVTFTDNSTIILKSELFKMNKIIGEAVPIDPITGGGTGTITLNIPSGSFVNYAIVKPTVGTPTVSMQISTQIGNYVNDFVLDETTRIQIDKYFESSGSVSFIVTNGEINANIYYNQNI